MLILCDFDGTITTDDITNLILDHYTGLGWRTALRVPYMNGEITQLEIMQQGYKPITENADTILQFVRERLKYRAGFEHFVDVCRGKNWPFVVVSGGIDLYLRPFLPKTVPFHCYTAELKDGWSVSLPDDVELKNNQDFKVHLLERLFKQHPGRTIVYIGDGKNDFHAAQLATHVFAVRGSRLARMLAEASVSRTEFESFEEIEAALMRVKA